MNRDKLRDYFGRVDFRDENECWEIMISRIRAVYSWLGDKSYLLDEYLTRLFSALSDMPSVADIGSEGFEHGSSTLWHIARHVRDGEDNDVKDEEMYPIIREYMDMHRKTPYDLRVPTTAIGLFTDYFEHAVRGYQEIILDEHDQLMEKHDVASARMALCEAIEESKVDELERAIYMHRWLVSPVQMYAQGLVDDIAMTIGGQSGCTNETAALRFIRLADK